MRASEGSHTTAKGSNPMEQEAPATEPGEEACEAAPLVVDCAALTNETLREAVRRWASDEERDTLPPMSTWNTSAVTNMSALFCVREDWMDGRPEWDRAVLTKLDAGFDEDISAWDTSRVTRLDRMFSGQAAFNRPIGSWRVDNVVDMRWMFHDASSFNQDISGWKCDKVTDMHSMFNGAKAFNQSIGGWCVDNVTDMSCMFAGAASFNQELGDWRVDKVEDTSYMFWEASSFNQPLGAVSKSSADLHAIEQTQYNIASMAWGA